MVENTNKESINDADYMQYVIKHHTDLGNKWLTEQWCYGNKESLRTYVERHLSANNEPIMSSNKTGTITSRQTVLPKDISDALEQFNKETKAGIVSPETSWRLSEVLFKEQYGGKRAPNKTRRRRR